MFWQIFTFVIVFFVILPITIIVIVKMRKDIQKIDVTANMPLVENDYRTEWTEGYSLGTLKSQIRCKNGCTRIEFYPIDVEQGEGIPRPNFQTIIVRNEFVKRFASGKLSGRRERIKLITRNPLLVPQEIKDETEGKWVTKEGQLGHITSVLGESIIQAGDEAVAEALKHYARGNIAKSVLAQIREENENYRKLKIETPEKQENKP